MYMCIVIYIDHITLYCQCDEQIKYWFITENTKGFLIFNCISLLMNTTISFMNGSPTTR